MIVPGIARQWLLACLVWVCWPVAVTAQQDGLSGVLGPTTTWRGTVRLSGDVTVPANGRLEISAGTVVIVAARDALAGGWHPDRVEIHVIGELVIDGTLDMPVVFVPEDGLQFDTSTARGKSWHGIVLYPRADGNLRRHVVRGAQLWRAFSGIQLPQGHALIEDCVFHSCSEGIQVGAAYKDALYEGAPSGLAEPEIRRSRFIGCATGVYCSRMARAHIEHCVFVSCGTGVGPARPGTSTWLDRPGSRVVGCAFVDVQDAIVGCSIIRECWFRSCKRAVRLSSYHDRLATAIEHVVFDTNLLDDVEEIVGGDTGAARNALRGEVKTTGALEGLRVPWPPLPDCLRLAPDSAGKARGLGGRDLGPIPGGGPAGEPVAVPWAGAIARGWLAAPVEPPQSWKPLSSVSAGQKVGNRWWAAADADSDGLLHLRQVFGSGRTGGLLALAFSNSEARKIRLHWSGDVAGLEMVFNGKQVLSVVSRRRFGAEEAPIEIVCPAGAHALVLRVEGWGVDPRFAMGAVEGWQMISVSARSDVELKAQHKVVRKVGLFEVKPSHAVHWNPWPGKELVELRDHTGRTFPVTWAWNDAGALHVTPTAGAPRKQELRLIWTGLRDLAGNRLDVEPSVVRLP